MTARFSMVLLTVIMTASSAQAADHRMKVGEVLLSNGGSTDRQYIELWNTSPTGEAFPKITYQVTVYDTDGATVGTELIGPITPGTTRWFLSTAMADAQFGTTADTVLDVSLPAVGQACFEGSVGARIHCLSWGCPNTVVSGVNGTSSGDAPADDETLSIDEATTTNDALYEITTATPDATNVSGTESTACPTAQTDAGPVTTDAAPPGADAATGGTDSGTGGGGGGGNDDGGGCRAAGGNGDGAAGLFLVLLAAAWVRRRRSTKTPV